MSNDDSAKAEHEVWVDVPGYDGLYGVSNLGRVRSHRRGKTTILTPFTNSAGYLQVQLSKYGRGRKCLVHRLVAEAFHGRKLGSSRANPVHHLDGDRTNNRADNLEWSDPAKNNLATRLSDRHGHKLDFDKADAIRAGKAAGQTAPSLAAKYGVHRTTIYSVLKGKSWVRPAAE